MDAGRILSEARRRAGLTQTELARLAGVPQVTISRIERRMRTPRVDTLDRLLEAWRRADPYAPPRPRGGPGADP